MINFRINATVYLIYLSIRGEYSRLTKMADYKRMAGSMSTNMYVHSFTHTQTYTRTRTYTRRRSVYRYAPRIRTPVSHGHRAALSGARSALPGCRVCVHACVRAWAGKRRVWHAYRAFVCGKNWHWAREGYRYPSFATRIDTPTGITKNTTLRPSRSRSRFLLFPRVYFFPLQARDNREVSGIGNVVGNKNDTTACTRTPQKWPKRKKWFGRHHRDPSTLGGCVAQNCI
ncbi:hypothetical protein PUN28_005950 [Cardiocondyla obscurior]|uniref:Uncharacterized protein n=1 Tax=Cardiocondyla obscurior TaxID=286306 RepID=A0AAW2G8E3_9HYME